MAKLIEKRNGEDIFEHTAPKYRNNTTINSVIALGMVFKLYRWLGYYGYEDTIEDVYNNTSGIRDGNEIHIHDEYKFDDGLYISYLYYHNGNVWAVLIDKANDSWYGEFEL